MAVVAAAVAAVLTLAPATQARQSPIPGDPDDRTLVHVLNRLGYGPAPGEIERVRRTGLRQYIEQQLHPERLADEGMRARLASFETLSKSTRELANTYFLPVMRLRLQRQREAARQPDGAGRETPDRAMRTPEQLEAMQGQRTVLGELSQQRVLRAAFSERQLQEVLVGFWFNHFNVFAGKGPTRFYLTEYERDVIRPHALGRFRDLLGATAHSPAMLFYLDNWQSAAQREPAARRPLRRPGVRTAAPQPLRQARGLNENYARELMELHTLGVDGGYTQKDVQEVARAFTGWTIDGPRQGGAFRFEPRMHDDGEKVVLGRRLTAGGRQEGEQVLDILAAHPSTARFIATKLARRFVADDPPASLVERAAARFGDTRGDIREVVRTIVTSPEFFAPEARRAKVKTPFEFVVSTIRVTGVEAAGALPAVQALRELGMPLYGCQPPTGYADRADAWVNAGALLARMNFAVALTSGRLRGMALPPAYRDGDAGDARNALLAGPLAADVSEATRSTLARATSPGQVLALVLGSPEFQRR
jgi:uncharacterized protein (DUF1800 family)